MVAPHSPYSCSRDLLEESLDMAKRAEYSHPYPCGGDQGGIRNYPENATANAPLLSRRTGLLRSSVRLCSRGRIKRERN